MGSSTVIRGGTVVDGTGAPGQRADVLVEDGRVVEVGPNLRGDTELDAGGHVVAPGFIDIHTHYDAQVFWDPALTPSCYHGVTTVVAGNCGFSIAPTRPEDRQLVADTLQKVEDMDPASLMAGIPWDFETFPEYLASVERRGSVINFASYLGHTPLRFYVMGDEASDRTATPEEVARMASLVREAMEAGAAGFATSFAITHLGADGRPIPSRLADKEEMAALCAAVGDAGRGVVGINGGKGMTLRDVYQLQPGMGAPVTYTALLTAADGSHLKALDIHRAGMAAGADVWPQVSCRPLTFSMLMTEPFTLNTNPVFASIMSGSVEERRAAYADPSWRRRVQEAWDAKQGIVPRWEAFDVMISEANPDLVGRKISDLAAEAGVDPFDMLLDLALAEPGLQLRVRAVIANDDTEGVDLLLREDRCTLGLSDAGAHVGQLCDASLSTDLLARWVRERGTLTLEQAVHKLTKVQADLFGFADRGVLRPGAWADVVVFDADTVDPGPLRRVADFPAGAERLTADQPVGMQHLMVNGEVVQRDGKMLPEATERRPGQVVRPAPRG
jgi:N-acyl-D-aspartate/D-glutamate deacylase